MCNTK